MIISRAADQKSCGVFLYNKSVPLLCTRSSLLYLCFGCRGDTYPLFLHPDFAVLPLLWVQRKRIPPFSAPGVRCFTSALGAEETHTPFLCTRSFRALPPLSWQTNKDAKNPASLSECRGGAGETPNAYYNMTV